jgi:hypothetical protein
MNREVHIAVTNHNDDSRFEDGFVGQGGLRRVTPEYLFTVTLKRQIHPVTHIHQHAYDK